MPDVSGNYLIHIARADPILKNVPLIVVTASDSEQTRRRALDLGADQVLTKPLERGKLVKHVELALRGKLELDASTHHERLTRIQPVNEKYRLLRGLGGRSK